MDYSIDPGIGYLFKFTVDGRELGMFTQVSGLNAKYDIETIKEGGENTHVHQLPGRVTYENIKLKRSLDGGSSNLAAWFNSLATNLPKSDATPRHNATIVAFGSHAKPLVTWNLLDVFPVSYKGPSFQAGDAKVLTEELELAHAGFASTASADPRKGRQGAFSGEGSLGIADAQRGASMAQNSSVAGVSGRAGAEVASAARAEVGGLF